MTQGPQGETFKAKVKAVAPNKGGVILVDPDGNETTWCNKSQFYDEHSDMPWPSLQPGVEALFTIQPYTNQSGKRVNYLNAAQSLVGGEAPDPYEAQARQVDAQNAASPFQKPQETRSEPAQTPFKAGGDREAGIHKSVALQEAVKVLGAGAIKPSEVVATAWTFYRDFLAADSPPQEALREVLAEDGSVDRYEPAANEVPAEQVR